MKAFAAEEEEAKRGRGRGDGGGIPGRERVFPDPSSHLLLESGGGGQGVPRAWGSRGRVNVVGHLVRGREGERLYFAVLEGPVRWEVVRGYLDGVAGGLTRPLRVFMDNASFHRSRGWRGGRGRGGSGGLRWDTCPGTVPI